MEITHPSKRHLVRGLLALTLFAFTVTESGGWLPPRTARAQAAPRVQVADVGFLQGGVEVQHPGAKWAGVAEGDPLSIGDRVRTLKGGTVRLDFPWTAISMGDGSEIVVENNRVLTVRLVSGRIDIAPEQDLLRVVTDEAAISGSGRTVVRREGAATFVGSYGGGAEVEGRGKKVRLGFNRGTAVSQGQPPSDPLLMGAAPSVVSPAADPRYVLPGQPVRLIWSGPEAAYHLEVLSIDSDVPVLSLDITGSEFELRLPWIGTFRWRVAGRRGAVESQVSGEGLICVVEK